MEETKKVVKKPVGFKANVKRGWKKFLTFIKKKYAQFMRLPKHIRLITYVWLTVLLVLLIIVFGTIINNKAQNKYKDMEDAIARAAVSYLKESAVFGEDGKTKVEMNVLLDKSLLAENEVANKTCKGFAVVEFSEDFEITNSKGYINCKKYTTKGYKDLVDIDKKNIKK